MRNLAPPTPGPTRLSVPLLPIGLLVALAACAAPSSADITPNLPPGVWGTYEDNATGALNQSSWAFASAANTRNNPVEAIRALVALEYLPEELRDNPRWIEVDTSVSYRLNQARDDMRRIVGIRLDTPPQLVINALLALSWDLQTGNRAGAMQVLASPIFTDSPPATLATISNLPYDSAANVATAMAEMVASAGGAGG